MLRWRLILGALFIAALVGLCWLDAHASRPGIYLLPLALVLAAQAAGELVAMLRRRDPEAASLAWPILGGVLIVVLAAGAPVYLPTSATSGPVGSLGWLALGLAAALLLSQVARILRAEPIERAIISAALTAYAILYVGGLVGFLVQLRLVPDGLAALATMIATVKMSDTGQYFVGRRFGKNKLAPLISPGKTWEGVAGGALFAIIGAALAFWISGHAIRLATVAYALALAAAGIVGDLSESLIKRDAGVKDSSNWMPGFGGILDLLDSLLVAAPVAYLFWALGWVGS